MADLSLPKWRCQMCRHPLYVTGVDSYAEKISGAGGQNSVHGSVLAGSKMDHSFVVLPKQRYQSSAFPPPRPRSGGPNHPTPGVVATAAAPERDFMGTNMPSSVTGESHGGRTMDESFVVLPSAAASMYRYEAPTEGGVAQISSQSHGNRHSSASFNASVNVLTRVFEIASAQTQVDQPLCLECMRSLSEELDKQVEEITKDIRAYELCLERLEKEQHDVLSEEDFASEKKKVEEEEKKLERVIDDTEKQNQKIMSQLQEIECKFKEFKELEERYWHDFNDYKLQLSTHQEDRDAILARIDVAQAQLEMLKRTNVLNDAFHIWHDGEFGTINNFRLGRLPNVPVEWDEINAAWGQACLLLSTMAQYCRLNFSYRILPMGSYPCIADNKNSYELFGPVNLFWSTRYDKAMVFFLACLKEFADFANAKDRAANVPPEKCFQLPYKIENDKVEGFTITQSFNRQDRWTKALKYTLCDLKWALYWLIGSTVVQPSLQRSVNSSSQPKTEQQPLNQQKA